MVVPVEEPFDGEGELTFLILSSALSMQRPFFDSPND